MLNSPILWKKKVIFNPVFLFAWTYSTILMKELKLLRLLDWAFNSLLIDMYQHLWTQVEAKIWLFFCDEKHKKSPSTSPLCHIAIPLSNQNKIVQYKYTKIYGCTSITHCFPFFLAIFSCDEHPQGLFWKDYPTVVIMADCNCICPYYNDIPLFNVTFYQFHQHKSQPNNTWLQRGN